MIAAQRLMVAVMLAFIAVSNQQLLRPRAEGMLQSCHVWPERNSTKIPSCNIPRKPDYWRQTAVLDIYTHCLLCCCLNLKHVVYAGSDICLHRLAAGA